MSETTEILVTRIREAVNRSLGFSELELDEMDADTDEAITREVAKIILTKATLRILLDFYV